jgi:hypothetical protein
LLRLTLSWPSTKGGRRGLQSGLAIAEALGALRHYAQRVLLLCAGGLRAFFALPVATTFKIVAAIHWEALRLWLKRAAG